MTAHIHHLRIHEDPAIDELIARVGSWDGVEVTDHGAERGVRSIDIAKPPGLIEDVEADIAGWSGEHPSLIVRPDDDST